MPHSFSGEENSKAGQACSKNNHHQNKSMTCSNLENLQAGQRGTLYYSL
jgi:hypothetical protein